jgi:hypothetical protein
MSSGLSRRAFLGYERVSAVSRSYPFLQRAAATGAGVVLVGASGVLLTAPNGLAVVQALGYGPLVPDPAGRLALSAGFRYTIVTEAGRRSRRWPKSITGPISGTGV